jgi:hypothetical protein
MFKCNLGKFTSHVKILMSRVATSHFQLVWLLSMLCCGTFMHSRLHSVFFFFCKLGLGTRQWSKTAVGKIGEENVKGEKKELISHFSNSCLFLTAICITSWLTSP